MIEKYKFYVNATKGEVVAVCRYAGRIVRGVAKCAPGDMFDEAVGKQLAYYRAEKKVKKIKLQNATNKFNLAAFNLNKANEDFKKSKQYYMDALDQNKEAEYNLKEYLEELSK